MKPKYFKDQKEFRDWLEKNYDKENEIWVGMWKKASEKVGLNYDQALEEALCFGWIDGIVKKYDNDSYMQRFTPRRSRSVWSKINVGHVERLIQEGRMTEAGLKVVEEAKKDGRWSKAYESPANMKIPKEFLITVMKNKRAYDFFKTLNKTNLYYIGYQLMTAKKEETKARRMEKIIAMLERGEKFY